MIQRDYKGFYDEAKPIFEDRIFDDYLRRFAYGIDASCYRYIPKLVVWAKNEEEIQKLFKLSNKYDVPLCFRAAGTSLSGQSCTPYVLVVCNNHWQNVTLHFDDFSVDFKDFDFKCDKKPLSISLDCGVIGIDANNILKYFNQKIGPDPATINNALIGGIYSNNSSGMCCGIKQNSYQTIKSVRIILNDGYILDTSKKDNIKDFENKYPHIINALKDIKKQILEDENLSKLIKQKFSIKNTTGYSINTFIDFDNTKDLIDHLFVGAEGTLGFVSKVELECVQDFAHKGCALLFYDNLELASKAIQILASNDDIVSAAEIMDYACLFSASKIDGMPEEIKKIKDENCAILIQLEDNNLDKLCEKIAFIKDKLNPIPTLFGVEFSLDAIIYNKWWNIRKAILPLAAANRSSGATVITEDICFYIKDLTIGINKISELFKKYSYDGMIFGHALSGNVHFVITPLLLDEEIERFANFMQDLAILVSSLNGSIKAEHGTGRMVAPFVELEWGKKAYEINLAIKNIFDEKRLINPDVIISEDKNIHIKNLKPIGQNLLSAYLDFCMECGFCEKVCPSKNLSLTPRQRIAVSREIKRLENLKNINKDDEIALNALKKDYEYLVITTCATCSSCANICPLEIDAGKIASKYLKNDNKFIRLISKNIHIMTKLAYGGVYIANLLGKIINKDKLYKLSLKLNKSLKTPIYLPTLPKPKVFKAHQNHIKSSNKLIYFSSCLNRFLSPKEKSIQESFINICQKADYEIIYPKELLNMCCGKAFKNNEKANNELAKINFDILNELSLNGNIPIVCDHSACSLELFNMAKKYEKIQKLNIYDMPKFILDFLSPKLKFIPLNEKIIIHMPCTTKTLNTKGEHWDEAIYKLALLCGVELLKDDKVHCCGFAGNKGFLTPELNKSSLANFGIKHNKFIFKDIKYGFSSSNTCELGLSHHSKIDFYHIVILVDKASR